VSLRPLRLSGEFFCPSVPCHPEIRLACDGSICRMNFAARMGHLQLASLLVCGSFVLLGADAVAQEQPGPPATEQNVPAKTAESSANADQSQHANPPDQTVATKKKEPRGAIVAAPIPISSPALGSGVVLVGGYIFPLQKSDKESFPSTVGAAVLITDNGSRAWALGGEFYARQNTYHITTIYFRGNLNYDFYGIGTDAGNAGLKLPLKQTGEVFLGDFLYRFKWKIFAGPRLLTGNSTLTLRPTNNAAVPPPPGIGIQTTLTGLGFHLSRDTRTNKFYPRRARCSTLHLSFSPMDWAASTRFSPIGSPSTAIGAWGASRCSPTTSSRAGPAAIHRFTGSASTARTISCEDMSPASTSIGLCLRRNSNIASDCRGGSGWSSSGGSAKWRRAWASFRPAICFPAEAAACDSC